jgi:hypothetical protein
MEKSVHVEDKTIRIPDGLSGTIRLYARGGALGIGELTDKGDMYFVELRRVRTHRSMGKGGRFRWYNDYLVPDAYDLVGARIRGRAAAGRCSPLGCDQLAVSASSGSELARVDGQIRETGPSDCSRPS